jgi:hypothetical protein
MAKGPYPSPLEQWVSWPRPNRASGNYNILDNRSLKLMCVCWMDERNACWFHEYYTNRYGSHFVITERGG